MRSRAVRGYVASFRAATHDLVFRGLVFVGISIFAAIFAFYPPQSAGENEPQWDGPFYHPKGESFVVRTFSDPIAFFTLVLAVSTIGLWIVTWRGLSAQSRDTRRSLEIAETAANAAKQSADVIPNLERAYVFLDDFEKSMVTFVNPQTMLHNYLVSARARFHNHGRTPANVAALHFFFELLDRVPTDDDTKRHLDCADTTSSIEIVVTIGSDKHWLGPQSTKSIEGISEDGNCFVAQRKSLYYWGKMEYRDIFGTINTTNFCRRFNYKTGEFEPVGGFERNSAR